MLMNCGVGEDSSRVPWTIRRSVNPKGDQPWLFNGRTNAEAEAPILWPPDAKRELIVKDLDAGKNWGQEEKGATEDEMVGCRQWLNGHEFEETLGDIRGQWRLVCYIYFKGLQRVRHNLATEQQQPGIELSLKIPKKNMGQECEGEIRVDRVPLFLHGQANVYQMFSFLLECKFHPSS